MEIFSAADVILLLLGALAGGFVNGLTGFGTALTAMPFWLYAVPPATAAQLAAASGAIGQLQTLPQIWHLIEARHVASYVVSGLIGVPVGLWLLPHVPLPTFKLGVGTVLVAYCAFMLFGQKRLKVVGTGRTVESAVGFAGGVLGGLAGLSGPAPTIWASLTAMPKARRRALFQSFNLAILMAMLTVSAATGLLSRAFFLAVLMALPATVVGVRLGTLVYHRLDDRRFDRVVLALLLASGAMLIWSNL